MGIAHIKNNRVINIISGNNAEALKDHPEANVSTFEVYDREIHPWGPYGQCDVEIGLGWRTRLKEKLGYCIFCGDHIPTPDTSGSL